MKCKIQELICVQIFTLDIKEILHGWSQIKEAFEVGKPWKSYLTIYKIQELINILQLFTPDVKENFARIISWKRLHFRSGLKVILYIHISVLECFVTYLVVSIIKASISWKFVSIVIIANLSGLCEESSSSFIHVWLLCKVQPIL